MSDQITPAEISSFNQRVAGKFVFEQVYCNVNSMVEFILACSDEGHVTPFSWDDVENRTVETVDENQVRFIVETCGSTKDEEINEYLAHFYHIDSDGDDEAEPFLTVTLEDILMARNQEVIELDRIEEAWEVYDFMVERLANQPSFIETFTFLSEHDDVNKTEETNEAYEWWAVSRWLYDLLKEKNEIVLDAGSCYVWGRGSSGQAIKIDGIIERILAERNYLYGQINASRYAD